MNSNINLVATVASYFLVTGCMPGVEEGTNNTNTDQEILMYIVGYVDSDADGYSIATSADVACNLLREDLRPRCLEMFENGEVATVMGPLKTGDCKDNDASVYPSAPELCDGKDNDCDGETDEGLGAACECATDAQCEEDEICSDQKTCIPEVCDDGDICTIDGRNADGTCKQDPKPGCCEVDTDCASSTQYCVDNTNLCQDRPACGDDKVCTTDTFDLATESCVHTPITGCECEDSDDCAATEWCNASHQCEAVPCVDDGDSCTKEEVIAHECEHTPIVGCSECSTDAQCAGTVPTNFALQTGGWWHLGNVSYGCLEGYCGSCVDADNDGYCAECSINADCPQGNTCEAVGSGATDKACVPQECTTAAQCDDGDTNTTDTCVGGSCHNDGAACVPSCSGRECGSDGCGGTCGVCGDGEACSAGQCVQGNTCSTDAQCNDSNSNTADMCFQGTCHYVAPGQCKPFAVRFVPVANNVTGTLLWYKLVNPSPRTMSNVTAGTYVSQAEECSVGVYNFDLTASRCLTMNGESPIKELPASPGVYGCVFNQ